MYVQIVYVYMYFLLSRFVFAGRVRYQSPHTLSSVNKFTWNAAVKHSAFPAHFFDVTPTGRIVNRFAKDLDRIELMVPFIMTRVLQMSMETLCTMGLIAYSTPLVLAVLVPLKPSCTT